VVIIRSWTGNLPIFYIDSYSPPVEVSTQW